jgi:hypothetical protein
VEQPELLLTWLEKHWFDGNSHPSILKIKNNTQHNTLFDFKPTDVDTINKLVSKINIKKATGVDQISSKLLRARSIRIAATY